MVHTLRVLSSSDDDVCQVCCRCVCVGVFVHNVFTSVQMSVVSYFYYYLASK